MRCWPCSCRELVNPLGLLGRTFESQKRPSFRGRRSSARSSSTVIAAPSCSALASIRPRSMRKRECLPPELCADLLGECSTRARSRPSCGEANSHHVRVRGSGNAGGESVQSRSSDASDRRDPVDKVPVFSALLIRAAGVVVEPGLRKSSPPCRRGRRRYLLLNPVVGRPRLRSSYRLSVRPPCSDRETRTRARCRERLEGNVDAAAVGASPGLPSRQPEPTSLCSP